MNKDKKRKVISTFTTIAVHLLLLIILMFVTLKVAKPDTFEDGVPVLLGNVEDAAGPDLNSLPAEQEETDLPEPESQPEEVEEVPAPPQPEDVKPQPAKPTPPPAPQITQTQERSIAAEEAKKKREEEAAKRKEEERRKAEEVAKRKVEERRKAEEAAKRKEEERRKAEEAAKRKEEERRKAEEERKKKEKEKEDAARKAAAINSSVAGAFGNGGKQNNSGESNGEGHQGSPNGNDIIGKPNGVGGIGTANVAGRTARNKPIPSVATPSSGKIVVEIVVDRNGKVTDARISINEPKDPSLNSIFLQAARKWTFSEGNGDVKGTITFTIPPPANR